MELKVWVEGIQRVICGVTDATTCQDVVIALAHATGKTGRFTLIERWRDNERLIAPSENPLRVLQKWGEYSSDVQFILRHSDQKRDKNDRTKPKDKFQHNFSPHADSLRSHASSIKKSLTFSGAHGSFPLPGASGKSRIKRGNHEVSLPNLDENRSLSTSSSSKSAMSPHGTLEKKSKQSSLPVQPVPPFSSHSHSYASSSWSSSSSFSGHASPASAPPPSGNLHNQKLPSTGILQDSRNSSSSRQDLQPFRPEEYDLDKHLGRVDRLSKAFNGDSFSEEEFRAKVSAGASKSDLARLVHLQGEKLAVQKSQISNVDSEIAYWEQRERDFVSDQQRINEENDLLRATNLAITAEVDEMEACGLANVLHEEQQKQKTLETQLTVLRSRLAKAETELVATRNNVQAHSAEVDKENSLMQQLQRDRRDAELKALQDISDVQKSLNLSLATHQQNSNAIEDITAQIKSIENEIEEKKKQITELERQLRDTNLQVFMAAPVSPTPEAAEHYVFSRLSPTRPGSTRKMTQSPSFLKEAVATPKNPHGLWV